MRVSIISELYGFIKLHKYDLLLCIAFAILYTIIHEAMHGLAVIAQGGTITDFSFIPSDGRWGYISYTFPNNSEYNHFIISLAPYLFSLFLMMTALFAYYKLRRASNINLFKARIIFFWLFSVPAFDLIYALGQYTFGSKNDLFYVFSEPNYWRIIYIIIFLSLVAMLGFFMQKKLYHTNGLSFKSYALLCGCVLLLLMIF